MSEFQVNIEGNFIDSFIYSGVLFTIDIYGVLCTYSWKSLIEEYVKQDKENYKFKEKLIDCRKNKKIKFEKNRTINLDNRFLKKHQKGICLELGVWTTDLDIKDNILYLSSERGLEALPFDNSWDNGKVMNFKSLAAIWSCSKVFGISTGSWGRTLLAAGENGALEVVNEVEQNRLIGLKQQEGKVIDREICLDCEWDLNSTIAILDKLDNKTVLEYQKLLSDSNFKQSKAESEQEKNRKKAAVSKVSNQIPTLKSYILNCTPSNWGGISTHVWFEEKKLVCLDEENKYLYYNFDEKKWIEMKSLSLDKKSYRKIKHTQLGLITETEDDSLYVEKSLISADVSSWRVFPRSKNYQDRINIINEEYLQVSIFD